MLGSIIGPISSLAGTWLQGRVDKAKAETEVKVAKARAEAKVYETEATSSFLNEQALTNQMGESWKDEAWSLWFIAVLTACFLPWTQEYVKEGFEVLATLPDWYQYLLYIAISASFGIKGVGQAAKMIRGKK